MLFITLFYDLFVQLRKLSSMMAQKQDFAMVFAMYIESYFGAWFIQFIVAEQIESEHLSLLRS